MREVEALIKNEPGRVHRVLFRLASGNPKLYSLQKLAKAAHIHTQQVEGKLLDQYARPNQGVVALVNEKELQDWETVRTALWKAQQAGEPCLVAVAVNIEDPRNLGACIRSALALGVRYLLLPAKGSCGITPAVAKASAGALEKLGICRPQNLEAAIGELKLSGFQITGLEANGTESLTGFAFQKNAVLCVGGEDKGLPPFLSKQCDAVLRIPMADGSHSLNASVALSLGLYEATRGCL
jgi:23S rRNA (guanosine2251-2'-O)-methyltransferase